MNTPSSDSKNIPDFLQHQTETSLPSENFSQNDIAFKSPMLKVYACIFVIWFFLVFLYIHFTIGWSGLAALLPIEFALFLTVVLAAPVFLCLLSIFLYKSNATTIETTLLTQKINSLLGANDKIASIAITNALKQQIQDLNQTVNFISEQTNLLKTQIELKSENFVSLKNTLEECFTSGLAQFEQQTTEFVSNCQLAAQTAEKSVADLSQNASALKENAQEISDTLNPLINETIVTAEHLKQISDEHQKQMSEAQSNIELFSKNSLDLIQNSISSIENSSSHLEKTFLKTADNCEDIFKRLDGSVSHIENSLKTHKDLAFEQANLLDKNSSFLDQKLGEYGKLISMEVEAMVKRSSTLDTNVKNQLDLLSHARDQIDRILDGANNSLEEKSEKAVQNIENIVKNLSDELSKLNGFISQTENKNQDIQNSAEKITKRINDLSGKLGQTVDELKTRSVEAIDRFNEVSAVVRQNTTQLSETANIIIHKGREGSEIISNQQNTMSETFKQIETVKSGLDEMKILLNSTSADTENVFKAYESQVVSFAQKIQSELSALETQKQKFEHQLEEYRARCDSLSAGNFMDQSAAMIENLENIAVDISRIFSQTEEDELWKKFYNGDHAAFARAIVKNLNRKQILKIREEYEKNLDFRKLSDQFISNFEMLLASAEKTDKPAVVLAMLSGSDLGKIYYVMARALDKIG